MKKMSHRLGSVALLVAVAILQPSPAHAQEKDATDEILKVGDEAPDFQAATFDGELVQLSTRFGEDGHPVVLLFSRASW